MASTQMNKEHYHFGGDSEIFLMNMIYKMQIIVHKQNSKSLILGSLILSFDLETLKQDCSHPTTCTSFPTIVQQIHPTQICSTTTCI